MKVVMSQKYKLISFIPDSGRVNVPSGWVLEEIPPKNRGHYTPSYIIVSELKYVDGGRIYFLKKDGRIEGAELAYEVERLVI